MNTHARRAPVRALAFLAAASLLAGCTPTAGDRVTDAYQQGSTSGNYISGDGLIVKLAADERDAPVDFAGALDDGGSFDSDAVRGGIVIVNFWYAACPPCRQEAPDLQALFEEYADTEVTMVGVNVRDTAEQARVFATEFGVGYPSIVDVDDNGVQLAFAGNKLAQNSVPTTLILDREGRVAARISGLLPDRRIVTDIVDELLAEKA